MTDLSLSPAEVKAVEPLGGTTVRLSFSDGTELIRDLAPLMRGPIFEALRNPALFAAIRVDEELGTVAWPNGADLDPDVLRYGLEPCPARNGADAWRRLALELSEGQASSQTAAFIDQVRSALLAGEAMARRGKANPALSVLKVRRLHGEVLGKARAVERRSTSKSLSVSMKVYTHARPVGGAASAGRVSEKVISAGGSRVRAL